MKKLLVALLTMSIAMTVTGCGSNTTTNTSTKPGVSESVQDTKWKPEHDITIRVPNAAGGSSDIYTRIFGQSMQNMYGKNVIVNNLTGANGAIALNDLLGYPGDACEMMTAGIASFTLTPLFTPDLNMKLEDVNVIGSLAVEDFVICVSAKNDKVKELEDLKALGAEKKIICAATAPGGAPHMLATALFGGMGVEFEAVTSDSANQNVLSVVSGDTDCVIVTTSVAKQYIEEGSVIPLAVFGNEESTVCEGVTIPTVQSMGHDIVFRACNFLVTTADVDSSVTEEIYNAYVDYQNTDEFKQLAENAGYVPTNMNGKETKELVESAREMCQNIYDTYYAK